MDRINKKLYQVSVFLAVISLIGYMLLVLIGLPIWLISDNKAKAAQETCESK